MIGVDLAGGPDVMVWVAGRDRGPEQWDLLGVFTTEEKAIARCTRPASDFIGPVRLNDPLPEDPTPWPGAYYPHLQKRLERC